LGESGSGKTTLLNELAGFDTVGYPTGKTYINGKEVQKKKMRKLIKYIQQDDVLPGVLTPREYLNYAAYFNLPEGLSPKFRKERSDEMIEMLGLSESKNVQTGSPGAGRGLSGGQRKRLHVASEIISDPPLLFADEPTSGLDYKTAHQCIDIFRTLADHGRTIICTIHQPSTDLFAKFTHVLLLTHGEIAYYGPVSEVIPYLAHHGLQCPVSENPANFLIDAVVDDTPERKNLIESYRTGLQHPIFADGLHLEDPFPNYNWFIRYRRNSLMQFLMLLQRSVKQQLRDVVLTRARLGASILVGIVIGCLYFQLGTSQDDITDRVAILFFILLFVVLTSVMPTVLTFPSNKAVFLREHKNNWYGVLPFYTAGSVSDIPPNIIFPIIFGTICYILAHLQYEVSKYLKFLLVVVLQAIVAQSQGVLISAAAPNIQAAVLAGPMTTIPFALFCGFLKSFDNMSILVSWIPYVSYLRYSMVALMRNEFYGLTFDCCDTCCCFLKKGSDVIDHYKMNENFTFDFWFCCFALCCFIVVFRILGYVVLRAKIKGVGLHPGRLITLILTKYKEKQNEKERVADGASGF